MVKMHPVRTISRKDFRSDYKGFYLAGFVDGEGSFNVSLRRKNDYKVKWQVVLSFNVSQKDKDVLDLIHHELACGIIKTRRRDGLHSFEVTNPGDIIQKIIPYFKRYPFMSRKKNENFKIFSKIAQLVYNGGHRDIKRLKRIMNLRERLNIGKGRKRKYGINDVFPSKKSSETIR